MALPMFIFQLHPKPELERPLLCLLTASDCGREDSGVSKTHVLVAWAHHFSCGGGFLPSPSLLPVPSVTGFLGPSIKFVSGWFLTFLEDSD